MRRAVSSVAVGLAGAAGIAASGWALQAAALPPPTPADRVAADASAWLHEYRFTIDLFHFDHRRVGGACLRGWFGQRHGKRARGSLLSLGSGRVLRASGRRVAVLAGQQAPLAPDRPAALAGCSGELASVLARAAQSGGRLSVARGYAADRPAIALKLSHRPDDRLTLYVSPRTYRPLVAIVVLAGRDATARLYLSPVRRRLLAQFHLLRYVGRKPRR